MKNIVIFVFLPCFVYAQSNATSDLIEKVEKVGVCPKGFKLYQRKPTGRNKMTKEWCMKVVEHEDVYDRPTARSVCWDYDAVITNVENEQELADVNALIRKNNKRVAVDGVFNPKCRGFDDWRMRKFGGVCAKEKELFILEDDHTDPTFIFTKWAGEPPTASDKYREKGDDTDIYTIAECLSLHNLAALKSTGNLKDFLCGEEPDKQVGEVPFFGVLCGCEPN
uniref:C-type lectin domain-containing protein n=1 Tax=Caenorhabditis tropicalis TaxID=1561998 RepID=A0A1I7UDL5_9PELO